MSSVRPAILQVRVEGTHLLVTLPEAMPCAVAVLLGVVVWAALRRTDAKDEVGALLEVSLTEDAPELEVGPDCQETIAASLVFGAYPRTANGLGNGTEALLGELLLVLHHVLEIVDRGEVYPSAAVELRGSAWQLLVPEQPQQVGKIVASVEYHPPDGLVENQTRTHQSLRQLTLRNTITAQLVKVYACILEHLDGILGLFLGVQVELEVELPGGGAGRSVAQGVGEGEAQLDEGGLLYVVPDVLVVYILGGVVVGEGVPVDDAAGELGVLSAGGDTTAMTLYFWECWRMASSCSGKLWAHTSMIGAESYSRARTFISRSYNSQSSVETLL